MRKNLLLISVYATEKEKSKIEKKAKTHNRSVSSYLKLKGLELI